MLQIIAQRYQLENEIGSGGMGTVYRGLDTQSKQTVAIKHLKPAMAHPDLIERFQREGQALRELNHPNMVKMLESLEEDGNHYLIMEYITGGDLKDLLQKGELSLEQVLKIAIEIADALTRAHHLNIIHRDLKPANILIANDGTARLTDFGIARISDKERITDTEAIIGTIDYLAPEAFAKDDIDHRVDIWALGILLFEMLTGDVPFKAEGIMQKIMAITTEATPELEDFRSDIPVGLLDLIYRMLEKDRNARIVSMRHVGAALEDIIQGRALHTPPETRFATPLPDIFERPKHNLPAQTTAFVGREAELTELAKLLDDPKIRLVTIVAQGGMGKTRLALKITNRYVEDGLRPSPTQNLFKAGVYFVELAPLSDPNNIVSAIADATGYQFQQDGREAKQQILDFLANKMMLLLIDNFEHLLAGASLVTEILNAAPNVQILATSRQRLNQSGETIFNLAGMNFPKWETPEDALEYAAVKLFMQSAKRVQPQFELTAESMDAVARICILVQGMPLGILLAASWLSMLSAKEITAEIAQSIGFLESDMNDLPERHRSIRAVFDYSWNLMNQDERDVFMKLSVFKGGFTREAAQAIAGANLRTLMNLMNKSLIRRDVDSGRYMIHTLLRQYGEEQLENLSTASQIKDSHKGYWAEIAYDLGFKLKTSQELKALKILDFDFENIRVAWMRAIEQSDYENLDKIADCLAWYSYVRNTSHDVVSLLEKAVQALSEYQSDDGKTAYGRVMKNYGWVLHHVSRSQESELALRQSLAIASEYNNPEEEAYSCLFLGMAIARQNRREEACDITTQALNIHREMGLDWAAALSLFMLGSYKYALGQREEAQKLTKESHDVFHVAGTSFGMIFSLSSLAFYASEDFKWEEAKRLAQEQLQLAQIIGHQMGLAWALSSLAELALFEGNYQLAEQHSLEIMKIAENINETNTSVESNLLCSQIKIIHGDYAEAYSLAQVALSHAQKSGYQGAVINVQLQIGLIECLRNHYNEVTNLILNALKFYHQISAISNSIECLATFAFVLDHQNRDEKVVELLGLAFHHPVSVLGKIVKPPYFTNLCEQLRSKLGEETYNTAYQRGKSLNLETVVQELLAEFGEDIE